MCWKKLGTGVALSIFLCSTVSAEGPDERGELLFRVVPGTIEVGLDLECTVTDSSLAGLVPEQGTLRWVVERTPGSGQTFVFEPNDPEAKETIRGTLGSLSCVTLVEPVEVLYSDSGTSDPDEFYFQTDYWVSEPWSLEDPATNAPSAGDIAWSTTCELATPYHGNAETHIEDVHNLPDQWYLKMTQTNLAWLVESGDPDVKVAIIDSGVDWRHPDLGSNIWQNPGEDSNQNGIIIHREDATDDFSPWAEDTAQGGDLDGLDGTDANGYADDLIGLRIHSKAWTAAPTLPYWDPNNAQCGPGGVDVYRNKLYGKQGAHGTQMASIIGAARNGFGCIGMCPLVSLVPINAGWSIESSDTLKHAIGVDDMITALDYAMAVGADIVNISLSYLSTQHTESQALRDKLADAVEAGIIICNSAGNNNNDVTHWPSAWDEVLCCAVVAPDTVKAHQSSFATYVDFCAPSGEKDPEGEHQFNPEWAGDEFFAAVAWGSPDPFWPWIHYPHLVTAQGDTVWADNVHSYKQLDGDTSGGAAQLSGAFALLRAHYPNHSREELIAEMVRGAVDVDPYQTDPNVVGKLGHGMINPYRSLTEWGGPRDTELPSIVWSDSVWVSGDYVVPEGATLTIQPGTTVMIANFDNEKTGDVPSKIELSGAAISAVGTSENPIRFVTFGPGSQDGHTLIFGKMGATEPGAIRLEGCEFVGFQYIFAFGSTNAASDTTIVANCDFPGLGHNESRYLFLGDATLRSCTFGSGWSVYPMADAQIEWCKFEDTAGYPWTYPPPLAMTGTGGSLVRLSNSIITNAEVGIRSSASATDTLLIDNVLVEHDTINERGELGIDVQGGVVKATSLTVRGYEIGANLDGSGRFSAEYSTFTDCYHGAQNNSTASNLMFFGYYADPPSNPLNKGGYNVFVDNEKWNIVNLRTSGAVQARKCWWGSSSGPGKTNKGQVDALNHLLVDPNLPDPPDFVVLADEPGPPFSVGRNFPNPFNPTTEFTLSVPRGGGRVQVTVYDIRGRMVRRLLDGPLSSGDHSIEFNGRNDDGQALPSGMYLCRFNFQDREEVVKATLVK